MPQPARVPATHPSDSAPSASLDRPDQAPSDRLLADRSKAELVAWFYQTLLPGEACADANVTLYATLRLCHGRQTALELALPQTRIIPLGTVPKEPEGYIRALCNDIAALQAQAANQPEHRGSLTKLDGNIRAIKLADVMTALAEIDAIVTGSQPSGTGKQR